MIGEQIEIPVSYEDMAKMEIGSVWFVTARNPVSGTVGLVRKVFAPMTADELRKLGTPGVDE